MRQWLPVLLLPLAVSGCRVSREAAVRTEYRYIVQRDSVRVDRWDTVRVELKGDTVRIFEKIHEREYYSTIYRDTLRRCDTLRIERTVVERQERRKSRWWAWMLAGAALMAAAAIGLKTIIKLYIKK